MNRTLPSATLVGAIALVLAGCSSAPEMRVDSTTVRVGEPVVVQFDRPMSMKAADKRWITLVPAGSEPAAVGERVVLSERDQSYTLRAEGPGTYELRLHRGYPVREHGLVQKVDIVVQPGDG